MMDFMLAPAVYQDRFNPPLRFVLPIQALVLLRLSLRTAKPGVISADLRSPS